MGAAPTGSLGVLEAKGDVLAFDGTSLQRIAAGPFGSALVADPTDPSGVKFASVAPAFDRVATALTISGTAAETTLYSVVIPANALGANGFLRAKLFGTFVADVLLGATYTLRVKFGGTTIFEDVSPLIAIGAVLRSFKYDLNLANRNATGSQTGGGLVGLSDVSAATVGVGNFALPNIASSPVRFASSAIDTTLAQTFEVTVQHSSANAGVSTVRDLAYCVLSPGA